MLTAVVSRFLTTASIIILLASCSKSPGVEHSFYYWKTTFTSDTADAAFLKQNNISHFYIRFFDVDFSYDYYTPAPRAELSGFGNSASFLHGTYTPVIFIANSTFQKMFSYSPDTLAANIRKKIIFINNKIAKARLAAGIRPLEDEPTEIQVDCDWTESTREMYFEFLRKFKALFPGKTISATIRLYPYKYRSKMGIPPVDKGLLMCYNMSNIKDGQTANSVFDIKDLKEYLKAPNNYPLPLDIGLPLFGWYAWFSNGKFNGIVYDREDPSLLADTVYFKPAQHALKVLGDIEINNHYLREGDVLREEFATPDALLEAADLLREKIPAAGRIAFYYYDPLLINRYKSTIEKVYSHW